MKLSKFGKLVFFILSYYLLFVILICENKSLKSISVPLRYFSLTLNWVILLLLTLGVILSLSYIFLYKKLPKKVFHISEIKNISSETLNYLITFILGLFFFNGSFFSVKLWVLILLLYLIYQAGGIYYLQPLLMLFGYQVFKCEIDNGNSIMVLTKKRIEKGNMELEELFEGIYLIRRKKNGRN
jgi:hypothetical protein